ncbi:hypothetical protein FIV42_00775 [Persicimonas caeni]|uniref:Uncharacterized protein n=1 Tax=Persicimonas caeni TaxID=2292766 RepID=A0A4Y6PM05_PERCE|nr:hypothetical protein [Persicimonas caeni]QDG49318.1 hypothetical protein FIV42_00775 [Persicimonas caeni]QED30539.1 hypothetical protein FRD00_00770 [Persicimonas caeni]
MYQSQQLATIHAKPDWISALLYRRDPQFESARKFGFFVGIVLDHWRDGRPGLSSLTEVYAEIAELGCRVQTSPDYSRVEAPVLVWHVDWILEAFHAARDRLTASKHKGGVGRARGEEAWSLWSNVDVLDATQSKVARALDISNATASRRIATARRYVERELADRNRLHV